MDEYTSFFSFLNVKHFLLAKQPDKQGSLFWFANLILFYCTC